MKKASREQRLKRQYGLCAHTAFSLSVLLNYKKMKIDIGKYQIELSEESNYKKDSMDNTFKFENHYFDEEEYPFSTQIGILQSVGTTQIEVYVMPNAKR